MLAHHRRAEQRPVAFVFPAGIRHHPVEVIEQSRDEKIEVALSRAQRGVDRQSIFADQMGDDGVAVADGLALVDDIGKLTARRPGCIEQMLMNEGKTDESQKRKNLQAVAVVIGDTEQGRIGVERDHPCTEGFF